MAKNESTRNNLDSKISNNPKEANSRSTRTFERVNTGRNSRIDKQERTEVDPKRSHGQMRRK